MSLQSIALNNLGKPTPTLGFGCSAMMGRVGRKSSLAALAAAYDAGVIFYDTARSYGYGESESLLGEFLRGRRDTVLVSTKFGILPAAIHPLKQALKPIARTLVRLAPSARKRMQGQLAAMSSGGDFSVGALHDSLNASLRALRTDYVDFLFLHEAPVSVLQQDDVFAALRQLVAAGKIRSFGIASDPEVIGAAITAQIAGLQSVQFPCNLFSLHTSDQFSGGDVLTIANHPFGGAAGIAAGKTLLTSLANDPETSTAIRAKLRPMDDAVLADVVLNVVTRGTGVQVVVPSMLRLDHLRANVAAMERSRFSSSEIHWLRTVITSTAGA